jgi:hypothetical protein
LVYAWYRTKRERSLHIIFYIKNYETCGARVRLLVLNKRNTTSLDIEGSTGTKPGNLRNLGKNKAKEVKETSERIYVLEIFFLTL